MPRLDLNRKAAERCQRHPGGVTEKWGEALLSEGRPWPAIGGWPKPSRGLEGYYAWIADQTDFPIVAVGSARRNSFCKITTLSVSFNELFVTF